MQTRILILEISDCEECPAFEINSFKRKYCNRLDNFIILKDNEKIDYRCDLQIKQEND